MTNEVSDRFFIIQRQSLEVKGIFYKTQCPLNVRFKNTKAVMLKKSR